MSQDGVEAESASGPSHRFHADQVNAEPASSVQYQAHANGQADTSAETAGAASPKSVIPASAPSVPVKPHRVINLSASKTAHLPSSHENDHNGPVQLAIDLQKLAGQTPEALRQKKLINLGTWLGRSTQKSGNEEQTDHKHSPDKIRAPDMSLSSVEGVKEKEHIIRSDDFASANPSDGEIQDWRQPSLVSHKETSNPGFMRGNEIEGGVSQNVDPPGPGQLHSAEPPKAPESLGTTSQVTIAVRPDPSTAANVVNFSTASAAELDSSSLKRAARQTQTTLNSFRRRPDSGAEDDNPHPQVLTDDPEPSKRGRGRPKRTPLSLEQAEQKAQAAIAKQKAKEEREARKLAQQREKEERKSSRRLTKTPSAATAGTTSDASIDVDALEIGQKRKSRTSKPRNDGPTRDEVHEIIDIASSPVKKAVIDLETDSEAYKPAARKTFADITAGKAHHPFFGSKTARPSPPPEPQITESTEVPKEAIDPSFAEDKPSNRKRARMSTGKSTLWSSGNQSTQRTGKVGWGKDCVDPRWPDDEEICIPAASVVSLSKRDRRRAPAIEKAEDSAFFRSLLPRIQATSAPVPIPPDYSVIPFISEHPAIAFAPHRSRIPSEALVDRYRPRSAKEVLGNELPAQYLVNWLRQLEIQAGVQRQVTRKVQKQRKRKARDDWMVDDSDPIRDFDDNESVVSSASAEDTGPYPSFQSRLSNSILLSGPHGSGKTAAIYAAAAELEWEVFEVYPGIGKRSGANIAELVGDVGKNHTIGSSKSPRKSSAMDVESDRSIRQSLILLEEVDVLYEEDKGFWQAVISLISESRRPVVMTCSDLALIPFDELALQTTLIFLPTPTYLAIPYLETIAKLEGAPRGVREIFQWITPLERQRGQLVTQKRTPVTLPQTKGMDLRWAISQIQVAKGSIPTITLYGYSTTKASGVPQLTRLEEQARHLDNISFTDAWVSPSEEIIIEACEIDRPGISPDDEFGGDVHLLAKPRLSARSHETTLPLVTSREYELAQSLSELSGRVWSGSEWPEQRCINLHGQQSKHLGDIIQFLDATISIDCYLLPHQSVLVDTLPYLSMMVRTEDRISAEFQETVKAGLDPINMVTGRPMRLTRLEAERGYLRRLVALDGGELDSSELRAARLARLNWR